MTKRNIYLLSIFILFLIISFLTPISGDDFGNYISTNGTLSSAVKIAISYYNTLEGRFIGRILIMYTTRHKIIWNILTSLSLTLIVSSAFKLLKKDSSYVILLLGICLLNHDMFSQSYTWLAGSITYLVPTCLTIFYFIMIYHKHNQYRLNDYLLLIILSVLIPLFVENIGSAFVLGNIIILIYTSIKEKKLNYIYIITTIISSVFLIIMLKSPGSAARSLTENIDFNKLNILEKILFNIKNFNKYIFFKNTTMLIITIIPIIYYLYNKCHKKILPILFSIIPLLSIINNVYYMLPMKFSFLQNTNIINTNNNAYIIYWIIYLILFVLSINYIVKNEREKLLLYFLVVLGFASSAIMLIIPTWGDRITLYTVLILTIVGVVLIDKIIIDKTNILRPLKIVYTISFIYLLVCFISINQINNYREKYIKKQLNNNLETIEVIRNPIMYLWNNNPQSDYFINTYKGYMNIPEDKDIKIVNVSYKDYLNIILGVKK